MVGTGPWEGKNGTTPDLAKKCKICDNFIKEIVLFLEGGPGGVRDEVREGLGERPGGFREGSGATDQPACAKTWYFLYNIDLSLKNVEKQLVLMCVFAKLL